MKTNYFIKHQHLTSTPSPNHSFIIKNNNNLSLYNKRIIYNLRNQFNEITKKRLDSSISSLKDINLTVYDNNNNNNNFNYNKENYRKTEGNKNNNNNKIMKTFNNIINENNNIDDNINKFKNKNNIIKKRENSNDKPHQRNPFVISKFNNNINNKIQSNTPDNKYKFLPKNLNRKTLNNNNNFNYNKENYRKTEGNKNKKSPLKTSLNVHNSRIKNKNNINNINESNIIKIDIRDALNKLKQMKIISSDDLQ